MRAAISIVDISYLGVTDAMSRPREAILADVKRTAGTNLLTGSVG